ncbi:hypothetical protein [Paracidovorax konjaci]|uniref:Uncharacterized protein n=1 Tax=Paracidovorax konjaci TaxID=32040 RepID=A0A1I1TEJ4_9BURK|nr:hypothetical protein [Paracidovorax konjaci]SFD57009.1 hypothetical protein SAMN04489710_103313 [Paracidovorax konjaci]
MPTYQDVTDTAKIEKQINKNIQDVEAAEQALVTIHTLAGETQITADPMSQWLGLLSKAFPKVQKWGGSKDLIEIYPAGTTGLGKSDRLKFQVGKTQVAVVEAYESEH